MALRLLAVREIAALQNSCTFTGYQHHNSVTEYKPCVYNSVLVTTRDCSVDFKINNYVIETANCFGMVESFFGCCTKTLQLWKRVKLLSQRTSYFLQAIAAGTQTTSYLWCRDQCKHCKISCKVRISNELWAMTCEDIVAIAIEHDQLYVMKMPVFETS